MERKGYSIILEALSTLYYFQRIIQRKRNFIQFLRYRLICVIFFSNDDEVVRLSLISL